MLLRTGPLVVTSAAAAEATHLFRNQGPALDRLKELPESHLEALRRDEVLSGRVLTSHAA